MVYPCDKQYDVQVRIHHASFGYSGNSPPSSSMVGALNKLPVAASGMLFFGDAVTLGSVSAVAAGFLAGVVYAVAKNNQKKAESARNQADSIIPLAHRKP